MSGEAVDAVYFPQGPYDPALLRLCLRALARHAPWIRTVHLVSGEEAPAWIRGDCPGLAVVRREDLVRDRTQASNPRAVEWQWFRIPGLARQFLYVPENCFLGRRLDLAEFQTAKGGRRFFTAPGANPADAASEALLNARFGARPPRQPLAPVPQLLDKTLLEEVHRLWEAPIQRGDAALDTLYFYYLVECPQQYGIHERAEVAAEAHRTVALTSTGEAWKQMPPLVWNRPKFFRLEASAAAAAMARFFLRLAYWRKASFEK